MQLDAVGHTSPPPPPPPSSSAAIQTETVRSVSLNGSSVVTVVQLTVSPETGQQPPTEQSSPIAAHASGGSGGGTTILNNNTNSNINTTLLDVNTNTLIGIVDQDGDGLPDQPTPPGTCAAIGEDCSVGGCCPVSGETVNCTTVTTLDPFSETERTVSVCIAAEDENGGNGNGQTCRVGVVAECACYGADGSSCGPSICDTYTRTCPVVPCTCTVS